MGEVIYLERGYSHQVWRKCLGCQAPLAIEGLPVKARICTIGCGSTWRETLCPDPLIPVLVDTVCISLGCTSEGKMSPPYVRFRAPFCPGGCLPGSPLPRGLVSMATTRLKGVPLSHVTELGAARTRAFLGVFMGGVISEKRRIRCTCEGGT